MCYQSTNYLDRFYSLNPQGLVGSKRLVVRTPEGTDDDWADAVLESATLVTA